MQIKSKYALWQGVAMVRIERTMRRNGQKLAFVVFDNRETAVVPLTDLRFRFDLMEGCEA